MAMLCLFGVCIPYSVLWPVLLVVLKQIWVFFVGSNDKDKEEKKIVDGQHQQEGENTNTKDTTGPSSKEEVVCGYQGHLQSEEQWKTLTHSNKLVFAKFTAKWCKPCKAIDPFYLEAAEKMKERAVFLQVDVDDFDQIAAENHAVVIPLVVAYKAGQRIDSQSGKDVEQIRLFLEEMVKQHSQ